MKSTTTTDCTIVAAPLLRDKILAAWIAAAIEATTYRKPSRFIVNRFLHVRIPAVARLIRNRYNSKIRTILADLLLRGKMNAGEKAPARSGHLSSPRKSNGDMKEAARIFRIKGITRLPKLSSAAEMAFQKRMHVKGKCRTETFPRLRQLHLHCQKKGLSSTEILPAFPLSQLRERVVLRSPLGPCRGRLCPKE